MKNEEESKRIFTNLVNAYKEEATDKSFIDWLLSFPLFKKDVILEYNLEDAFAYINRTIEFNKKLITFDFCNRFEDGENIYELDDTLHYEDIDPNIFSYYLPFERLTGYDFTISAPDWHGQRYYRCIAKDKIKMLLKEDVYNNPLGFIDKTFIDGIGLEVPNELDEEFIEENNLVERFVEDYETNFGGYKNHFGCEENDFEFRIVEMNGMEFYLFFITEDEL